MTRQHRRGRPVNGVILLNKPSGMTSNCALQRVRHIFCAAKAGHTGSLDPLATGLLPVCLGEATKFTSYLLDADKRYQSTFRFGIATATGDSDGEVLQQTGARDLTAYSLKQAIKQFCGLITQVPSMYSAVKHQGQPLYKLARAGREVERKARKIRIYDFRLLDFRPGALAEADVEIHCTKGTYVRTIAEDIGEVLGCGAHVSRLHRSKVGPFGDGQAVELDELVRQRERQCAEELDRFLLPVDATITHLPALELPESVAWYFCRGHAVMVPQVYRTAEEGDIVRVFQEDARFLGIGKVLDDGRVKPDRLLVY